MRSLLRILSLVLMLLVVALVSALLTMQLAIHGREVQVPDFRGKTPAEARLMAEDADLNLRLEREYYNPSVAAGRVLSQTPGPGETVRRGWDVRVALSLGPQRVSIPQIAGESQRAAVITMNQRGLDVGSTATTALPDIASGQVAGQDPPANAGDVSSPKINLLVAGDQAPGEYVTPSFIGQPIGSVSNALKGAGFSLGRVTTQSATAMEQSSPAAPAPAATPSAASIITAQDPAPGQRIAAGSAINFVVR